MAGGAGVSENVPVPMASGLRPSVPTLGTLLQDAGYETAYFGKWHLTNVAHREPIGVERMRALFASYGFEVSEQSSEVEGTHGGHLRDGATVAAAARFLARRGCADRRRRRPRDAAP